MIDPSQLEKKLTATPPRGVKVNLYLSPYDIPDAVSGDYDKATKRFVIQFKYLGDEPKESQALDKNISLRVGKNSHRIYEIAVDVGALDVEVVALEVKSAIDKFEASYAKSQSKESYRMAREILTSRKNEIFAPLAMAT